MEVNMSDEDPYKKESESFNASVELEHLRTRKFRMVLCVVVIAIALSAIVALVVLDKPGIIWIPGLVACLACL
jgi:hypothetical protein